VAKSLTSTPAAAPAGGGRGGGRGGGGFSAPLATTAGINTTTWDLRYPPAVGFPGLIMWGASLNGPAAAPGTYTVKLTVDGQSFTQPLVVERNPLYAATDADLQAQFDFLIKVRDKVTEANTTVIQIRAIKEQIADRLSKSNDVKLKAAGDMLAEGLGTVEAEIYQVKNQSGQDPLNFPIRINNQLASVLSMVGNGDGRPTTQAPIIFAELTAELKKYTDQYAAILAKDLPAINAELARLGLAPIAK
jgi:hypothetical protein